MDRLADNILSQINNVCLPPGKNQVVINNIAIQQVRFDYGDALDEALKVGMGLFRDRLYKEAVDRFESKEKAAEALGVSRTTIYQALQRRIKNEKAISTNRDPVVEYCKPGDGG